MAGRRAARASSRAGPGDPLTGAGPASVSAGRAPWRRPSPGHQQVGRAGPHIQVHLGPGRHVHVLEQPPEPRPARLPDGDEPGAYRHEPPERFGEQARLDGTRRCPVPFVRARTRTRGDIHLVDRITSTTWISIRPNLASTTCARAGGGPRGIGPRPRRVGHQRALTSRSVLGFAAPAVLGPVAPRPSCSAAPGAVRRASSGSRADTASRPRRTRRRASAAVPASSPRRRSPPTDRRRPAGRAR